MTVTHDHVDELLAHLTSRDADAALDLVLDLADRGVPSIDLLTQLLGPAQVEVGRRWHRAAYNVADEHAATAIVDAIVSVLGAHSPPVAVDGPRVAVVCAEGEWHLLAARLVAEVLRAEGFPVTFLGASMPPPHLARFLESSPPDVVAISCTTAMSLDGVLQCTQVAHDAGVPVIVGGSALGPDGHRAHVLGADLWAPTPGDAVALLRGPVPRSLASATADVRGALELTRRRDEMVERALQRIEAGSTELARADDAQRQHLREDLEHLVEFGRAAVLTRDPRVLADALPWLEVLLGPRGVPAPSFRGALEHLAAASGHPGLRAMVEEALQQG